MSNKAVINPFAGKKSDALGPVALMAATRPDVDRLAAGLGFAPKDGRFFLNSRVYSHADGYALAGPFIGAPHAVMLLENLICRGAEKVIFTGWCGSVSPDLTFGDILVPDAAFSDEGTSAHYPLDDGNAARPSASLSERIVDALRDKGLAPFRGAVWTTDAIYRETPEKIDSFRSRSALAVEMELSALLTVAAFRNIELAAALVISDEVWSHTWNTGFKKPAFKINRSALADALATLVQRMTHGHAGSTG